MQPGLSLRQARALCPHARFIPADPARYRHAFDALLEVLAGFTPLIEPSLVLHSALCWLDLGKLGKPEAAEMRPRLLALVQRRAPFSHRLAAVAVPPLPPCERGAGARRRDHRRLGKELDLFSFSALAPAWKVVMTS